MAPSLRNGEIIDPEVWLAGGVAGSGPRPACLQGERAEVAQKRMGPKSRKIRPDRGGISDWHERGNRIQVYSTHFFVAKFMSRSELFYNWSIHRKRRPVSLCLRPSKADYQSDS